MNDRQTGRTTRLMLEAIEWRTQNPNPVIFVIHSRVSEGYYRALWRHLGAAPDCIRFMTPANDFSTFRPSQVFVDHHVHEVGYSNHTLDVLVHSDPVSS